jgi:hypothetical protein
MNYEQTFLKSNCFIAAIHARASADCIFLWKCRFTQRWQRIMKPKLILGLALVLSGGLSAFNAAYCAETTASRTATEKVLMVLAATNAESGRLELSPDGKHVAYFAKAEFTLSPEKEQELEAAFDAWTKGKGGGTFPLNAFRGNGKLDGRIWLDGVPQLPIWTVDDMTFTPDSQHLAYVVRNWVKDLKGNGHDEGYVVWDGIPKTKIYPARGDMASIGDLQVSADSTSWSAIAVRPDPRALARFVVLINGKEEQNVIFQNTHVLFSPVGHDYAYQFGENSNHLVIHNGKKLGPYFSVDSLQFSGNGQHLAFLAKKKLEGTDQTQSYLVLDDQEQLIGADDVSELHLNHDGSHYFYALNHKIYLDGKSLGWPGYYSHLTVSPDGQHLAYVTQKGRQFGLVVDGQAWRLGHSIMDDPVFSPDSQHVAVMAAVILSNKKWSYFVMLDGKSQKSFSEEPSRRLVFSPDGNRLAYFAKDMSKWVLVVDGIETSVPGEELGRTLTFSPDGKHVAALVITMPNEQTYSVMDGESHPAYLTVKGIELYGGSQHLLEFSPDSQHLVYAAKLESGKETMIVDGVKGQEYDQIPFAPELHSVVQDDPRWFWFDNENELRYVAVHGDQVLSVEENLK